ncbi:MAG: hypothetical protein KJO81_04855 [Gammaproteobacteria bacterium]|nr:hypothetical protein [Gammaproteobacteria bacterium]
MQKPNISTAIPKQRYKFGAYTIVVLEEIESETEVEYVYLLAGIKDGHNEPEIYITCEKAPPDSSENGSHIIRVFAKQMDEQESGAVINQSNSWQDREAFISYGLSGFKQMLGLDDEEPYLIAQ